MRCLGIPNTAHFANITKIADAVECMLLPWQCLSRTLLRLLFTAVWKKLSVLKDEQRWKPEVEEEFEDSTGNVVSRKTYEDLKRQGLL